MKKILFILIILIFPLQLSAQYGWTNAEIYLKNGTVLKGEANLTMMSKDINLKKEKVKFRTNKNGKKSKYIPEEVDYIIFTIKSQEKENGKKITKTKKAKYIPIYLNNKQTKLGFAELIIDGKMQLVGRTVSVQRGGGIMFPSDPNVPNSKPIYSPFYIFNHNEIMFLKEGEKPEVFNQTSLTKSFKKRASKYFKDCPILQNKIKNKDFKKEDLEAIVNYYNSSCN
ncbi:hypothetical protein [Mesoflavibacter sp. CH_XMU1422-2]|uniref:hypothetical protein n=1 Tax=Mesoflavibacter sp. CH_XMU1422-2 TaxID=3107770 RepID=UPI00300B94DA